MRRQLHWALGVVLCVAAAGQLIQEKDKVLAEQASEKAAQDCVDFVPLTDDERDSAREHLQQVSGGNFLLDILKSLNSTEGDDATTLLMEQAADPAFVAQTAGPLVAAVVFMAIWILCCCWTPCCRCCRCCRREWRCHPMCKLLFVIALGAIGLGLVTAALLALRGLDASVDGVSRTACTSARFVNATLSGNEDPRFLGLIPVLERVENLMASLDENSEFMTDLKGVLGNTQQLSDALNLASKTMTLLNDMMLDEHNQVPKRANGESLLHQCELCVQLSGLLGPAIASLAGSLSTVLDAARAEVDKQLSGERLEALQGSLTQFTEPIQEFMASVHGMFGPFVEQDLVQQGEQGLQSVGPLFVLVFALLAGMLVCCGLCSACCWCKTWSGETKAKAHRCACITWCCGCCYIWVAFFIGGLLVLLTVPLASFCLILDDFSGETLQDLSGAAGVDLSGPDGAIVVALVDQCFRRPDESHNPALLDIVTVESSNGTRVPMRRMVVDDVTDQINAQFERIGSDGETPSIRADSSVQMLIQTLANFSIDAMIFPQRDIANNPTYQPMAADGALAPYFASSAACGDFNLEGQVSPGIENFSTALAQFGTQVPDLTCAKTVICADLATTQRGAACAAANGLMELKQGLRTASTFKCRTFQDENGRCNITNMAYSGDSRYTNDCFRSDGTLEVTEYDCTLEEFTALVKSYSTQLDKAFERVDSITPLMMQKIATDMYNLVDTHLIQKIVAIADGVTCGFMAQQYFDFVDGMCFRGVWGFHAIASSYVACAVLTLFLVIVMYAIWRFALDTYEFNKRAALDAASGAYAVGPTVEGQPLRNPATE